MLSLGAHGQWELSHMQGQQGVKHVDKEFKFRHQILSNVSAQKAARKTFLASISG